MCGIVGFFGDFDKEAVSRANATQCHRGPDDTGDFFDVAAGVGLGHLRLAILDLSPLGHQPMAAPDGSVVLTYNGEIYNFAALRAELETEGTRFRGSSDTEVLLQLYLRDGESMLSALNGIFAFAIWDRRTGSLFVARDALGVKPLYYLQTGAGFAFASELKALLHFIPGARDLDYASLHRYASFMWCPAEGTPLRSVRKLLPGEALIVREGRIARRWAWYELPAVRGCVADLDEAESVRGTESKLRAAVHRQLVADVPVGAFLSGGLDSSAVVTFARERSPDIRCFSIETLGAHEEGFADDLPYARRVARHLGVALDVVAVQAVDMAADVQMLIGQLDEPLADPAALNVLYISRLARERGIKVLLSGAGGDDLFTGYRRHLAASLDRYWARVPSRIRRAAARVAAELDQRRAAVRRASRFLSGTMLSADERMTHHFFWPGQDRLASLYTPEFRIAVEGQRADAPMLDFLANIPASVSPLERMLALEQRFFLADHNLLYTDKMSMAASVEVRVPFLDTDLVEHAARIPAHVKQRGAVGKWVLKKAMEPYLPRDVIYRPKTGFGAPLRRWMRNELRPLVEDALSADSLRRRGLYEPGPVHALIRANDSGEIDASYTLFSLVAIELWCRRFIDIGPGT